MVDHLFRHEAAKIVAVLTRIFGLSNIELAEDIVQDSLYEALTRWKSGPLPDNPGGWLMDVAKKKTINVLRRQQRLHAIQDNLATTTPQSVPSALDDVFADKELRDSQLRMIFTCCHPSLAPEGQIALTLKTLCGFSVKELANALLSNEATINKRLYRAKKKFRDGSIAFEVPAGAELDRRLQSVYVTLYLLFNEGYNSSHPEELIRRDLCAEAVRLVRLLTESFPEDTRALALLALMLLHAARFASRLDRNGAIVIFAEQDRGTWDRQLINEGVYYLHRAAQGEVVSAYHLEAGIAAEHCLAPSFEQTNWHNIYRHYDMLSRIKPGPVTELNKSIIVSRTQSLAAAIAQLRVLEQDPALANYYLLYATLGEFSLQAGDSSAAREYFLKAQSLTESRSESALLLQKIALCG